MSLIRRMSISSFLRKSPAIIGALLFLGSHALLGQAVLDENKVKAVFLYNFTNFIEWPQSAFRSPDASFVIGFYGEEIFGNYLRETVSGETVSKHRIMIRRIREKDDIEGCHMIFIDKSDAGNAHHVVQLVRDLPVLTVSDAEDFVKAGGMLRLYREGDRMRIQINAERASAAGLKINPKLLKLASLYREQ